MTERRADEATRDVMAWLKCYYMQDHVGEIYSGRIVSVVPFGLFVQLEDIYIEGLVHVSDLGMDYFRFDEVHHCLLGERTGKRFRLADRVKVQVVRVDLQTNKIDFRLLEGPLGDPSEKTLSRQGKSSQPSNTFIPKSPKTKGVVTLKRRPKVSPAPSVTARQSRKKLVK